MSPSQNEKLKTLQRRWYARLKKEGFEDAEDTNSPREFLKSWHSMRFGKTYDEAKEEYYRRAEHFLNSHKFKRTLEKDIWAMHADGKALRTISKKLDIKYWVAQETVIELTKLMMEAK